MRGIRIGSAFGIPIKLGVSFLLIFPVIAYLIGSEVGAVVDAGGEVGAEAALGQCRLDLGWDPVGGHTPCRPSEGIAPPCGER
jgi:hypothetical protein